MVVLEFREISNMRGRHSGGQVVGKGCLDSGIPLKCTSLHSGRTLPDLYLGYDLGWGKRGGKI